MKITYVEHSSFIVSLNDCNLLFDYYKGDLFTLENNKPLYVFSSHAHWDHFNIDILKQIKNINNITLILSKDIKNLVVEGEPIQSYIEKEGFQNIYWLGENESLQLNNQGKQLVINTLKSTDEGVAFLVNYDGKNIFHSGDLHWWSWIGESEEYNNKMEEDFKSEINKLIGKHIDVAFLVLDPRLEIRYDWGMNYCINHLDIDYVIPMHCQGNYTIFDTYRNENKDCCKKVTMLDFKEAGSFVNLEK